MLIRLFNRKPNRSFVRTLLSFVLMFAVLSCTSSAKKRDYIPTGVNATTLPDRSIQIVSTGRASNLAIDKDSTAMMQATSREAAILLLKNELKNPKYVKASSNYKTISVEFLYRGEYCRITGNYNPRGSSVPVGALKREMDSNPIPMLSPQEAKAMDSRLFE